jgi:transposase
MKTVCGLDVHKDSVFVCILLPDGGKNEQKFGVTTPELLLLRGMLLENGVIEVAMESTSIYWIPIWRILEDSFDLKLVNPYFIKQLPGRKSDIKDAQWIATVLQKELIKGSFVPDQIITSLRQYGRRVFKLVRQKVRVEQAIDRQLQRCNIRISNYISTIDSKAMQKIMDKLIEGIIDPDQLVKCVHTRTKNKHGIETIKASLTGHIEQVDIDMLCQFKEEQLLINKQIEETLARMSAVCKDNFPEQMQILQAIPGIKERSAMMILSEIGSDLKKFLSSSALVGWAGLKPRNDESAGKIKSRKTTHGNKYLRVYLVQAAWASVRTQSSRFNFKYNLFLSRKMKKQKALIAIARKLLVVIWNIISKNEQYRPYTNAVRALA